MTSQAPALACQDCFADLAPGTSDGEPLLRCCSCNRDYPVTDDIPSVLLRGALSPLEKASTAFYDATARLQDRFLASTLPVVEGITVRTARDRILGYLLPDLNFRPTTLLDVGTGTGSNLDAALARLGSSAPSCWGLDVSMGMLKCAKARLSSRGNVRFVHADVHRMPFRDHSFDATLHVGAFSAFRDPQAALQEMVRVTRPGGRVVVIDEGLDSSLRGRWWGRIAIEGIGWSSYSLVCPVTAPPPGTRNFVEERAGRFFYALHMWKEGTLSR